MLIGRRPALVKEIGRAPGQREIRFAHLLSGDVDIADIASASPAREAAPSRMAELEQRVQTLEEEVAKHLPELKDMQLLIDGSPVSPQRQMTEALPIPFLFQKTVAHPMTI